MSAPETAKPTKCPARRQDSVPCDRPSYDDKGLCICHSKDPNKDRDTLQAAIREMLGRHDYDFTGFVFPGDVSFSEHREFRGPVWFRRARFCGKADFNSVTFRDPVEFRGAQFATEANFQSTKFEQGADFGPSGSRLLDECTPTTFHTASFLHAQFRRNGSFVEAVFRGQADFQSAIFETEINFCGAQFKYQSDFSGAVFHGRARFGPAVKDPAGDAVPTIFAGDADFWRVTFNSDADFEDVQFQGKADFRPAGLQGTDVVRPSTFKGQAIFRSAAFGSGIFSRAQFGQSADFRSARFGGQADFAGATFEGQAQFVGDGDNWVFTREGDADFSYIQFGEPRTLKFQHVFLGQARFLGTDVRQIDFTDVKWAKRGRLNAVWDELASEAEGQKDYALIGKLYRQLKHNYEEQRDPITAGDFHFGEMHMRRLSNPPKNAVLRFFKRNLSFLALYRWISGYGEDYILPLVWIASVVPLFTGIFACVGLQIPALAPSRVPQQVHGFWPHLLYSVRSFLLRPGEQYQPTTLLGHYLTVAEGIIGPPLIAMFVLALNRRFKR